MVRKLTRIELFKILGGYDETHQTRFVYTDEFEEGDYVPLRCKNGSGWCRLDGTFGQKYKVCMVRSNGEIIFSPKWEISEFKKKEIEKEIRLLTKKKTSGNSIYMIKIYGILGLSSSRPIRKDISTALKKNGVCVSCGKKSSIEIDHKNGLYNDSRVLNIHTQTIEDFQTLCKACNAQKRQTYVDMKKTRKRYSGTNIPGINLDFTYGDETYDPDDINAMVGTYWYDIVAFRKRRDEIFAERNYLKLTNNT